MTLLNMEEWLCLLSTAESLYSRLILLVGRSGSGKSAVLRDLANHLSIVVININLELSQRLLELTAKQRSLRLPVLFDQIMDARHAIVILDNLEILFAPKLRQDPLRLLQRIARNRCVVASWNGSVTGGKLTYAAPGHPEYRTYKTSDVLIVEQDHRTSSEVVNNVREAG